MLPSDWGDGYRNVWLGITTENQEWFDRRRRQLQNIPALIKFISYEPAIGLYGCRNTALTRIGLYRELKVAVGPSKPTVGSRHRCRLSSQGRGPVSQARDHAGIAHLWQSEA
jgi:Protein of unknown function (DUF5131)